tara:strand:+ start:2581 stop:3162 length:582 start_codon:yes stop_codon:yes gene_type:complete
MKSWIKMIADDDADDDLSSALNLAKTPHNTVDNVLRVHSLRPSTMIGHMTLYKSVLHDEKNTIPKWFQETISSYVSLLNECDYSFQNHWRNACHLINDKDKSDKILLSLNERKPENQFKGKELALLVYAEKLTLNPSKMNKLDYEKLKEVNVSDEEILEANQIICYFNYVNRSINGLGVTTEGDIVGYYSNAD